MFILQREIFTLMMFIKPFFSFRHHHLYSTCSDLKLFGSFLNFNTSFNGRWRREDWGYRRKPTGILKDIFKVYILALLLILGLSVPDMSSCLQKKTFWVTLIKHSLPLESGSDIHSLCAPKCNKTQKNKQKYVSLSEAEQIQSSVNSS